MTDQIPDHVRQRIDHLWPDTPVGSTPASPRPPVTVYDQTRAALEWRALFNGILAAILIGIGILVSWASGAMSSEPGHRENGAAAFIAGIICLIGIGVAVHAWRCYKASRVVGRMTGR